PTWLRPASLPARRDPGPGTPWPSPSDLDLLLMCPDHELGLDGQLLDGPLHGGPSEGLGDPAELEEDPSRLDDSHPELGVALTGARPGLGGLGRRRLVREAPDPALPASTDVAGHGDTGGLDLAGRDPTRLESLDPVVAECDRGPALGLAGHPTTLHL